MAISSLLRWSINPSCMLLLSLDTVLISTSCPKERATVLWLKNKNRFLWMNYWCPFPFLLLLLLILCLFFWWHTQSVLAAAARGDIEEMLWGTVIRFPSTRHSFLTTWVAMTVICTVSGRHSTTVITAASMVSWLFKYEVQHCIFCPRPLLFCLSRPVAGKWWGVLSSVLGVVLLIWILWVTTSILNLCGVKQYK